MGASNVYIGYHSFKHSGAILGTTEGQTHKKTITCFQIYADGVDGAFNNFVVISDMQDHFFSCSVSERVS